jgi:hypothetical protein
MDLTIALCNPKYIVGKLDVKGAFFQMEMMGIPVYIKYTGAVCKLIVEMYPGLQEYVGTDGMLYCRLKKALYVCVQASKLWYQQLCKFLEELGYEKSEVEACLFCKVIGEVVYILLVYVDDIHVCAEAPEIQILKQAFINRYKWITLDVGIKHSYLGMQTRIKQG